MINISIRTTEEIIMNELLKIEHARKVYQSRFKGVQVEALKDIQLEVIRVNIQQLWANLVLGRVPC